MTPRRLLEPARLAGASLLRCQDDGRLIDMVRDGQDRAFEAIVARHRTELFRHCRRLLPPGRAEDALQQAFLNAYQAIKADPHASIDLRPWLHRIAHNACLSALRQNGWRHEEIDPDQDGAEGPDQVAERRQDIRSTLAAVQALPERQRDALLLRELEGRSHESIAAELGVTDGAVRQLLHRARTTLRTAATAVTPADLLYRMAGTGSAEGSIASRIAEAAAGAGGGATLAKVGAAVLVSGAIAGGAATVPGPIADTDYSARAAETKHAGEAKDTGSATGRPGEHRSAAEAAGRRAAAQPGDSKARSRRRSVAGKAGPKNGVRGRLTAEGERRSASGAGEGAPESRSESQDGWDGRGGDSDSSSGSGSGDDSGSNDDSRSDSSGSDDSERSGSGSSGSDDSDSSDSGSGDDSSGHGGGDSDDDDLSGSDGSGSDDEDDDRSGSNSGSG